MFADVLNEVCSHHNRTKDERVVENGSVRYDFAVLLSTSLFHVCSFINFQEIFPPGRCRLRLLFFRVKKTKEKITLDMKCTRYRSVGDWIRFQCFFSVLSSHSLRLKCAFAFFSFLLSNLVHSVLFVVQRSNPSVANEWNKNRAYKINTEISFMPPKNHQLVCDVSDIRFNERTRWKKTSPVNHVQWRQNPKWHFNATPIDRLTMFESFFFVSLKATILILFLVIFLLLLLETGHFSFGWLKSFVFSVLLSPFASCS